MLLNFKLANYKSFRDPVSFDLLADIGAEHEDKQILTFNGKRYKKTIVFYGANANGKSNFIEALLFMKSIVMHSKAILPGEALPYNPFFLDDVSVTKPTLLELEFAYMDIRYRYSFSFNQTNILSESLYYAPNGNMVKVFVRQGQQIEGRSGMEQITSGNITAPNKLFLATAASFNNEPANAVFNFFVTELYYDRENTNFSVDPLVKTLDTQCYDAILEDPDYKVFLLSLLQAADFNIVDIDVQKTTLETALPTGPGKQTFYKVFLAHDVGGVKKMLYIDYESKGTKTLLYLSHLFYESFISEKVFIVDELETSLHPSELSFLVRLFAEKSIKSQLFFTAHSPCILAEKLLRRDEYYFVDKTKEGVSQLYSLADFSVRKDTSFAKEYYLGRYGAVPLIKDGLVS
jgi:hypothetical protein